MRTRFVFVVVLALAGCSSKKDTSGGTGSSEAKPIEQPVTCPPGNVVKNGTCIVVVTAETVAIVVKQQSRLDDLAKLLDHIDTAAAPIELLNAFRKLDEWNKLTVQFDKLKMVDAVVAELDNGIRTMRTFKAGLGEAAGRLGNLKAELDRLMKETGVARKLEEVRAEVGGQVRATMEPLAAQVTDTIKNALVPLTNKLEQVQAVVELTCASLRLGGGGDQAKMLCTQAKDAFSKGLAYLADFKQRPATIYSEITTELENQLDLLIDTEVKKALAIAQATVNDALRLPPAGSATGPGSAIK